MKLLATAATMALAAQAATTLNLIEDTGVTNGGNRAGYSMDAVYSATTDRFTINLYLKVPVPTVENSIYQLYTQWKDPTTTATA